MLRGLRPPQHRVDHVGQFIKDNDDALDQERVAAELAEMAAARVAAIARARTPIVERIAADLGLTEDERAAMLRDGRGLNLADNDDILEAVKAVDLGGLRPEDHPLAVYFSGESRYDLQASGLFMGKPVNVRDYFRKAEPTIFSLRRLDWATYNRLLEIQNAGERLWAFTRAGVVAIHGPGVDLDVKGDAVPNEWMQALFDADHNIGIHLGAAVISFNRPLSESEKKGAPATRMAP